jgi:hypothetical protein
MLVGNRNGCAANAGIFNTAVVRLSRRNNLLILLMCYIFWQDFVRNLVSSVSAVFGELRVEHLKNVRQVVHVDTLAIARQSDTTARLGVSKFPVCRIYGVPISRSRPDWKPCFKAVIKGMLDGEPDSEIYLQKVLSQIDTAFVVHRIGVLLDSGRNQEDKLLLVLFVGHPLVLGQNCLLRLPLLVLRSGLSGCAAD